MNIKLDLKIVDNTYAPNEEQKMTKSDDDNHSNQCNPNNDAYWESRGEDQRPDDWEERTD